MLCQVDSFLHASALRRPFPNRFYGELVTSWLVSLWRLEERCAGLDSGHMSCSFREYLKALIHPLSGHMSGPSEFLKNQSKSQKIKKQNDIMYIYALNILYDIM